MDIEKNICDSILRMLMNITGKAKDVKGMQDYFEYKGFRPELLPQVMGSTNRNRTEEEGDNK